MEIFKLLAIFIFTFQSFFPMKSIHAQSNIFRTYIGSNFKNVKFSDVPINPDVEFHFIISFAIDYTAGTPPWPADGDFNIFWDTVNLTPDEVSAIKTNNYNVKVALAIGGSTVNGQVVYFQASSVDSWVSNAVSSLTKIIQDYNLDGIDINYENFQSDSDTFAQCVGQLVSQLKDNGVISTASIAPYDCEDVQDHYQALWNSYGQYFDYVNFQFYAYDQSITVDQFIEYFDEQSCNYNGGKVLVSYATNGDRGLSADGILEACGNLRNQGKLQGIFVWSADDSVAAEFAFEKQSQALLATDCSDYIPNSER